MKRSGKILLEGTIEEFKKHCKGADNREYLLINTKEIKKDGTYAVYLLDSNSERVIPVSIEGKHSKKPPISFFCKLTLNNGDVVEIEGGGTLIASTISGYSSTTVRAIIGKSCTSIGNYAFAGFTALTAVSIKDGVTNIGEQSFYTCTALTSVNIPNSVTSIEYGAFKYCYSLTSITIENATIGANAFDSCIGLTTLTLGDGVTSIDGYAFGGCSGLQSISIGNGITSISSYMFAGLNNLTTVSLGNGITSIGEGAFVDCPTLTSISCLATTAPTIESQTFLNINSNGTLYVPQGSSGYDAWLTALGNGWTIEYIS